MSNRHGAALSIQQALEEAPALQRLGEHLSRSERRLQTVLPLLPPPLRTEVASGTAAADDWCLLVPHHAAAAKIRQLLPTLLDALHASGDPLTRIRVKVRQQPQA